MDVCCNLKLKREETLLFVLLVCVRCVQVVGSSQCAQFSTVAVYSAYSSSVWWLLRGYSVVTVCTVCTQRGCSGVFLCVPSPIRDSIMVSIPACHAGDRGSIPRHGVLFCTFSTTYFHSPLFFPSTTTPHSIFCLAHSFLTSHTLFTHRLFSLPFPFSFFLRLRKTL